MSKQQTKKQMRQSAVASLLAGLVFSLVAIGFFYLDWREQLKILQLPGTRQRFRPQDGKTDSELSAAAV